MAETQEISQRVRLVIGGSNLNAQAKCELNAISASLENDFESQMSSGRKTARRS